MRAAPKLVLLVAALLRQPGGQAAAAAVFRPQAYGAKGDGKHNDTAAVLAAVAACEACAVAGQGGCSLLFEGGSFLTGPIVLPSHSTITVAAGATLMAAPMGQWRAAGWTAGALLSGRGLTNVTLTGGGTIDGNGAAWWGVTHDDLHYRPGLMIVSGATDLFVEDILFLNSPNHNIEVSDSTHVRVRGLRVSAPHHSPNTDGINFAGGHDQSIEDSHISNGDDCVSIVCSGSQPAPPGAGGGMIPSGGNVLVRNVTCDGGHGVSIGSIKHGYVSNVTVENVRFFGSDNGARIKTYPNHTGLVRDVVYRNIVMSKVINPILINGEYCPRSQKPYPCPPGVVAVKIRGIVFENISGTGAVGRIGDFSCSAVSPCSNITLRHINLTSATPLLGKARFECTHAHGPPPVNVEPTSCLEPDDRRQEPSLRVHSVAVPKALRARRPNARAEMTHGAAAAAVAAASSTRDVTSPPPGSISAPCAAELDAWCARRHNNSLGHMDACYATLERENSTLPMVAAFTINKGENRAWRCYSPDNLAPSNPILARKYHCPVSAPGTHCNDACSGAGPYLEALLRGCDPNWTPPPPPPPPPCPPGATCPLEIIGPGLTAPDGETVSRAHEPSLLYLPPDPAFPESLPNGTLMVVSGIDPANPPAGVPQSTTLGLRTSNTLGHSWSALRFPFLPFSDAKTVGSFFQNQLLWDSEAKTVHIVIGNITSHPGGCDGGSESLNGMLHISSTDRGQTFTTCVEGSCDMPLPDSPTTCLAPTSGHGVQLSKPGPHKGRLLFVGVHNAYKGDVVAYSDDHGTTFKSSGALHQPGLDEGSIAQLPNGSLITIFRNCFLPGGRGCQGDAPQQRAAGVGGKRFYVSVSDDAGVHWSTPRAHPDLVTPVCQGSVTGFKESLYFAGPYSETSRHNLTILGSDDNGVSFTRSLLITQGPAGYTGLQCGLAAGQHDCAVVYDAGGKIDFMPFSTKQVK
jgi:polygalacturonase